MKLTEDQLDLIELMHELNIPNNQIVTLMQAVENPTDAYNLVGQVLKLEERGNKITKQELIKLIAEI